MNGKILVTSFSASGVTAGVARELAQAIGADLCEIAPVQPYSSADLDWTNKKSRSTLEMQDPASRPAMKPLTVDPAQYDTIFVGSFKFRSLMTVSVPPITGEPLFQIDFDNEKENAAA